MSATQRGYVALVGRPNVGKSTLFNRLTRTREAIVHDQPGVTRDRHYGRVILGEEEVFTLIDTGGFEPTVSDGLPSLTNVQVEAAVEEADAVLFLVDGRQGLNPLDAEVAGRLRRQAKRVVVAVNKLDSPEMDYLAEEFHSLGFGPPIPISAEHNLGISSLIETIIGFLPKSTAPEPSPDLIRVAVVGRPNVGKSSLINCILGQERLVVSAQPGTTRDAVDTYLQRGQRHYSLIDTAGIRRSGRITVGVERWSVLRAMKAIDRADVAVVVADAVEGLTDQEAKICGLAVDSGRALVLAVNKWDLIPDPDEAFRRLKDALSLKLKFLAYAPWIVLSALTGRNVGKLFQAIEEVHAQYCFRAGTPEVNKVLEGAVARHPAPLVGRGRLKFYFATQAQSRPPTFVVFTNHPDEVHFSYARYLTNQFKEAFGLTEIPIKIVFRARTRRP